MHLREKTPPGRASGPAAGAGPPVSAERRITTEISAAEASPAAFACTVSVRLPFSFQAQSPQIPAFALTRATCFLK